MTLISKTTTLHVHHDFLYISLPFLHYYDVKMPNFLFYAWGTQTRNDELFLSLPELECSSQEINSKETRPHFTFSVNWNKRDKV